MSTIKVHGAFGIIPKVSLQLPSDTGHPDFREDLESFSNLGPCTTKGYFIGIPLRDLLSRSSKLSNHIKP